MPQEKAKVHKLSAVPNREGAGFAVDFAKESEVCPKCYDTGMEIVVGKGARICSCRKLKATSDESALAGFPNVTANVRLRITMLITLPRGTRADLHLYWQLNTRRLIKD